jgi:hypothetical protein
MGPVERKEIAIGFAVGLLATLAGFYIYVEFVSPHPLSETMVMLREEKLYGKVLGLAAIPNLFVFFVFLKKKQDLRARGVLLACFLAAFLVLLSQFM